MEQPRKVRIADVDCEQMLAKLCIVVLAAGAAGWQSPWPQAAQRMFDTSPEWRARQAELSAQSQAREDRRAAFARLVAAQEQAAQELLRATSGLDRGALASAADASRVAAAIAKVEEAAPCREEGAALIGVLADSTWRLVWTSSLVGEDAPAAGAPRARPAPPPRSCRSNTSTSPRT